MLDQEKVIQALEICANRKPGEYTCDKCTYETRVDGNGCEVNLMLDAIGLLKEQEANEQKTGHWIFESAYCEAWSHTCSECGKRMTTAYNTYANYCWNCGTKMKDHISKEKTK